MRESTVLFDGVAFRAIDRHEAHALIGGLRNLEGEPIYDVIEDHWRFPAHEQNAMFLLAEDDVEMENLSLAYATEARQDLFILGFIFQTSLKVERSIVAWDTDNSPALIVLGDLRATNVKLFGNVHTVAGSLRCDTVWGQYNHGELHVLGAVTAWLVHADDMPMHFGRFAGVGAVVNNGGPHVSLLAVLQGEDGVDVREMLHFPSTHRLSDMANGTLLATHGSREQQFAEDCATRVLASGMSLLDHDNKHLYEYRDFPYQIEAIFVRLETVWAEGGQQTLAIEHAGAHYVYQHFESEGRTFRQISKVMQSGYDFALRATQDAATRGVLLDLDYFDDEGVVVYQWSGGIDDPMFELKCVKCAVLEADEVLR